MASDLEQHGSDTLRSSHREAARTELAKTLHPYQFKPEEYGLVDHGRAAIVEMHILSLGESLFLLGGGKFQKWIEKVYRLHNAGNKTRIYKVCRSW